MRRHFFPSERVRRRRFIAMAERQLEGNFWKWPWETWKQATARRAFSGRTKMAQAAGGFIRDRLREASFARKILPPQVIHTNPVVQAAVDLHHNTPLSIPHGQT